MRGKELALLLGAVGGAWALRRAYLEATGYDFTDKTVLITGGSRGLGLALSRVLAEAGSRVVICARDEGGLARAKDDLEQIGGPVYPVRCDVSDPDQVRDMVAQVRRDLGPIDVLINNAGTITVGPHEHMTLEDFRQAMGINFYGALHTILEVLPEMRQRREGRIVNISSIGGKVSVPHLLPYSASKFALTGLSEGLRAECADYGVTVTTIIPGLMRTGSPRNATFKGQHRSEYAWFTISDSLPGLSMDADRAARQIVGACRRGEAEAVLSLPAKFGVLLHGVAPGLTSRLTSLTDYLLPGPGGVGEETRRGYESESGWAPSALTALTEEAARRNNEMPAPRPNG